MSATDVVLVDAGGTNIGSVRYALERLGVDARISADAGQIRAASHVILPGVGAAVPGMQRLRDSGLVETMQSLEQPVLGVCLGMQLLFEHSDEGNVACLGVIPGRVRRIEADAHRRVPHMGWNRLCRERDDRLLERLAEDAFTYFVHSYAVARSESTLASVDYGAPLSAIVRHRNYCGMQFHPERSSAVGALLLKNFLCL
ncbi:MAG TPA: imidazole glycerol phosphate synthase subunit HisH [Dokdonella sp.]|uniref:imidazole glycerol phosphate synthase subunit HisH n=1 Tax=Dokdonella sp. TaxID=2291710 RepID=UPI002D7EEF18|nr:imidazole glycerol phosphate synthase subunit HisH [Dokdonella sp.]HET9032626.1 imidazole glycerol phosphate synthase subunit HisH [Dokdonella sp.]